MERMVEADIIFVPYNYLINSTLRKNIGLNLKNSILIFDEAHNIFNSAESITIFHNISVNKKEQNRFRKYDIRFFPIKSNTNDLDLLEILKIVE